MRRGKSLGFIVKYWKGRAGQQEYWIGIAMLIAIGVVMHVFGFKTGSVLTVLWFLLWARRLHDFGESGWWGLLPIGMMFVFAIAVFIAGGPEFSAAFAVSMGRQLGHATPAGNMMVLIFWVVMIFVQLGFTVWLGFKRGDDGDNAYGPPSQLSRKTSASRASS